MKAKKLLALGMCVATVMTMSVGTAFAASTSPASTNINLKIAKTGEDFPVDPGTGEIVGLNYEVPEAIQLYANDKSTKAQGTYTISNHLKTHKLDVVAMQAETGAANWTIVDYASADSQTGNKIGVQAVAPNGTDKYDLKTAAKLNAFAVENAIEGTAGKATFIINAKFPAVTAKEQVQDITGVAKIVTTVKVGAAAEK